MPRTAGSKNEDYDESRMALARRVSGALCEKNGSLLSFREMATVADVSVATLRHYFRDRSGVIQGVFEFWRAESAPHLALAAMPLRGDVRVSLQAFLTRFATAWNRFGVGRIQATALGAGLTFANMGEPYVNYILEPLLQAAENLLQRHTELGEITPCEPRVAALHLLSPVVLALLHQDSLNGARCRPLDLDSFFESHLEAFLRAYPPLKARKKSNLA